MTIFNNANHVLGKGKIIKIIERSRKPSQRGIANADIAITKYTRQFGIVCVQVRSFRGEPILFVARLRDMIELHEEGSLCVSNMNIGRNDIHIKDMITEKYFITSKKDIKYLPLRDIPHSITNGLTNIICASRAYIYWGL